MILAANFKMNHTRASTREYLEKLEEHESGGVELYVFPPATALQAHSGKVRVGAQNAYAAVHGSFTGEIGLQQLQEFGINTLILGHSERRHIFGESQELIAKKFAFYKEQGFRIFYCVGETSKERDKGSEAIHRAIEAQLVGVDLEYEKLIVAYEPVWAIGTGKSATPEDITEVLAFLRSKTSAPLLYGGSVKPANIQEILHIEQCDGALIGTASWDITTMQEMIDLAKEI
ncbi:triose-phosphate isomerase [Nitratiruptor sp. YY09-18]|uniref:triose-phosphate isomerase n=1 Tax=Nitratiruptor sp. YY09-18 TaxID=2724901 RepID=UPI001915A879|nr:triose-phosphate isomerase [Nitratiruptor sp. YY09-18]BCD68590.1 triosephosphate isomerase [Nitratiruptor sp. YY09-18]